VLPDEDLSTTPIFTFKVSDNMLYGFQYTYTKVNDYANQTFEGISTYYYTGLRNIKNYAVA